MSNEHEVNEYLIKLRTTFEPLGKDYDIETRNYSYGSASAIIKRRCAGKIEITLTEESHGNHAIRAYIRCYERRASGGYTANWNKYSNNINSFPDIDKLRDYITKLPVIQTINRDASFTSKLHPFRTEIYDIDEGAVSRCKNLDRVMVINAVTIDERGTISLGAYEPYKQPWFLAQCTHEESRAPKFHLIYDGEEYWAPVVLQVNKGIKKYRAIDNPKYWKTMDLTQLNKNDQDLIDTAVRIFLNPTLVPENQKVKS